MCGVGHKEVVSTGTRPISLLLCLTISLYIPLAHACSTLVAAKGATSDGSVMSAHSNDGDGDTAGNLRIVPSGSAKLLALTPQQQLKKPESGLNECTHLAVAVCVIRLVNIS